MAIKKYSKVKFTLRKELIFILAAIVLLVVATILLNLPNAEEKFISKWNAAGSTIAENTLYEEVSFDELEDILASKGATEHTFVYFATPSSADSVTYFDLLIKLAPEFGVEKIYLVDSAFALNGDREQDEDFDAKLSSIEDNFKCDEDTTMKLESVPNFWLFEGDVLVESASDTISNSGSWNKAILTVLTSGFDGE